MPVRRPRARRRGARRSTGRCPASRTAEEPRRRRHARQRQHPGADHLHPRGAAPVAVPHLQGGRLHEGPARCRVAALDDPLERVPDRDGRGGVGEGDTGPGHGDGARSVHRPAVRGDPDVDGARRPARRRERGQSQVEPAHRRPGPDPLHDVDPAVGTDPALDEGPDGRQRGGWSRDRWSRGGSRAWVALRGRVRRGVPLPTEGAQTDEGDDAEHQDHGERGPPTLAVPGFGRNGRRLDRGRRRGDPLDLLGRRPPRLGQPRLGQPRSGPTSARVRPRAGRTGLVRPGGRGRGGGFLVIRSSEREGRADVR